MCIRDRLDTLAPEANGVPLAQLVQVMVVGGHAAPCQQTGVRSQDGDEAILDAAAYRSQLAGKPVRAANAYVFRYWLGGHFYYVSTNYCCDPVCVLHLPGKAKMRQLTVLYHKYTRSGRMPENQNVWRLCCLPAARPPLLRSLWVRLRAKIGI